MFVIFVSLQIVMIKRIFSNRIAEICVYQTHWVTEPETRY